MVEKNGEKIQFKKIIAENLQIFFFFLQGTHFHIQEVLLKICCYSRRGELVPWKDVWHFHLLVCRKLQKKKKITLNPNNMKKLDKLQNQNFPWTSRELRSQGNQVTWNPERNQSLQGEKRHMNYLVCGRTWKEEVLYYYYSIYIVRKLC